jgi:hypothetical protein
MSLPVLVEQDPPPPPPTQKDFDIRKRTMVVVVDVISGVTMYTYVNNALLTTEERKTLQQLSKGFPSAAERDVLHFLGLYQSKDLSEKSLGFWTSGWKNTANHPMVLGYVDGFVLLSLAL